jgi:hypothetical protein
VTDNQTSGVGVFYGGPADGMEVTIELDPDSGQPTSRWRVLNFAPPVAPGRPGLSRPPDVSYVVAVDKPTGVADLDGQGRLRYVIPGTKL